DFIEYLDHNRADVSSLQTIITGGSEPSTALIERLGSLGIRVLHAWGMTETEAISSVNRSSATELLARQGVPLPGLEMKLVDEVGELPWDGQSVGMLLVRGAWVAKKYLHEVEDDDSRSFPPVGDDDEDNDRVWLRTGD